MASENVTNRVERDFGMNEREEVLELLSRVQHDTPEATERVQLAVLELSRGNLIKLRHNVEVAVKDFRDVLSWVEIEEKERQQRELLRLAEFEYRGKGFPAPRGASRWAMTSDLYFRCTRCGYFMSADLFECDSCICGAMFKDAAAGRFRSTLGDQGIEVYRLKRGLRT